MPVLIVSPKAHQVRAYIWGSGRRGCPTNALLTSRWASAGGHGRYSKHEEPAGHHAGAVAGTLGAAGFHRPRSGQRQATPSHALVPWNGEGRGQGPIDPGGRGRGRQIQPNQRDGRPAARQVARGPGGEPAAPDGLREPPEDRGPAPSRARRCPSRQTGGRRHRCLWVPRISSKSFNWTFTNCKVQAKMTHGAVLPLHGFRSGAPDAPASQVRSSRTGRRGRRAPTRDHDSAPPSGTPGSAASGPSGSGRAESARVEGWPGSVLRAARDIAPLASRPGPSPMDASSARPFGTASIVQGHGAVGTALGQGEP